LRFARGQPGDDGLAAAEQALALDPTLAEPHAVRATVLHARGKDTQAHEEIELALRMDPESDSVNGTAALISYDERRFEDAIRYYRKLASLAETQFGATGMLISANLALGDRRAAEDAARMTLERTEKALAKDRNNGNAMGFAVSALATLGEVERAKEWMERAILLHPDNNLMRYNFACSLCTELGDTEAALAMLGPVFPKASISLLAAAKTDPDLDPIRNDPRFKAMVAAADARLAAERAGES
jgi:adenylate cyclase